MLTRQTVLLTALVLFLFTTTPVAADSSLPGTIRMVPHLRFDNLDDYPDYVFYLYYRCGRGNPYAAPITLVLVESRQFIRLESKDGDRYADLGLIAVPRRAVPPLEADRDDDWLAFIEGTHRVTISEKDFPTSAFLVSLRLLHHSVSDSSA